MANTVVSYHLGVEKEALGALTTLFEDANIVPFSQHLSRLTPTARRGWPWFEQYWMDLHRCNLPGMYLHRCNLPGMYLHRCNLPGMYLHRCNLPGMYLHRCKLPGMYLHRHDNHHYHNNKPYSYTTTMYNLLHLPVTGYDKYRLSCDPDLVGLSPSDRSVTSAYVIDAVYAIARGLHDHISKYCAGTDFCQEAR